MEHRHINTKDNEWGVAVVHSIWERGSEDDICTLILEVKRNTDAVRRAISHSDVFGQNFLSCVWTSFMGEIAKFSGNRLEEFQR